MAGSFDRWPERSTTTLGLSKSQPFFKCFAEQKGIKLNRSNQPLAERKNIK